MQVLSSLTLRIKNNPGMKRTTASALGDRDKFSTAPPTPFLLCGKTYRRGYSRINRWEFEAGEKLFKHPGQVV